MPAGSPTLRSLLCDMPALGRTLTHPDSPPVVLEMSKAPILVQLLAAHRRSVMGAPSPPTPLTTNMTVGVPITCKLLLAVYAGTLGAP